MQSVLRALREICCNNLIEEKILIVPTRIAGQQIMLLMAKMGIPCLNVHIETIASLSERISKGYIYKEELTPVSRLVAEHIVMMIVKDLSQEGQLRYFDELKITPGVSRAIYDAILDMKMAGLSPNQVRVDAFINPLKGEDLQTIYLQYQQMLEQRKMVDRVDLTKIATRIWQGRSPCGLFILPVWLDLKPVEKQLLSKIDPVQIVSVALSKADSIDAVFAVETDHQPRISLFQAYGENNELREVFRRIKQQRIPLEKVAILYTSCEPYSQLCYNLAQRYNVPVTYGQGINLRNTKPGRLLFGLLEWINSGFEVTKLYPLFISGDWRLPNSSGLSGFQVVNLLRAAEIGWGRGRYLSQLYKQREASAHDHGMEVLLELFQEVFAHIPAPTADGKVRYRSFVEGLAELIEGGSALASDLDVEARILIEKQLKEVATIADETVCISEAVQLVLDLMDGSRVGCSGPKPGHIHVEHYEQGPWISRQNTFVVGLDAQRFPGSAKENPIILDGERQQLGELELKKLQPKINLAKMLQTLVSLPGTITVSYSACNPVENKESYPAALLLQLYRRQNGDQSKDYGDLLASFDHIAGYIPASYEDALENGEWWLKYLEDQGALSIDSILEHYAPLREGNLAVKHRQANGFSPYDGKVAVDGNLTDPRVNRQLVLSSSQLEKLATCPFGYFLKYILRAQSPEELQYNSGMWLDAPTRGSLLHNVFEGFYRGLHERGEKPELSKHATFLYELAKKAIQEQRELVPPPNEAVFEQECKELLESCQVFLVSEEKHGLGITPRYFELAFGMKNSSEGHEGANAPVTIELPDGRCFNFRGKIDRVDQAEDQSFQVLDYKTGSSSKYNETKYYQGGRQLQHTLYAIAFEQLMQTELGSITVSAGGYLFPTVSGEGKRILREQSDRTILYDILDKLMEILATGTFAMTDHGDECRYCEYTEVCNRDQLEVALAAKYGQDQDNPLELIRRLRAHE